MDRFPEADLGAGEGAMAEFNLNEARAFLTGDVHPAFWPFFAPQRFTTQTDKESLDAVKPASYARIDRVMAHLDGMLDGQLHVVNQKRTVADPYAFAMCRWTQNIPRPWTHSLPSDCRVHEPHDGGSRRSGGDGGPGIAFRLTKLLP